ncbi:MAG TPA: OmpA family protein [Candidatus Phocaeicola gallinarum]|nr:OmpA family protein [Candidatus Phocaeicola gallinarum]
MKKLIILGLAAALALPSFAQAEKKVDIASIKADSVTVLKPYKAKDNWFFGVYAGTNFSFGENTRFNKGKMFGPSFGLSVGKWFSPAVGARLRWAILQQHHMVNTEMEALRSDLDPVYKHGMTSVFFDGLFNFNNIFSRYREDSRFNVIGVLGIGFNSAFGFSDNSADWTNTGYEIDTDGGTYLAIHAGLMLNYKLNNAIDLNLEATYNATDDAYNGVRYDRKYDGYMYIVAGMTWHFKDQYGDRRFRYVMMTDQAKIDELNRQINDQRAQLVPPPPVTKVEEKVVENEVLNMTVSFIIDKYNITDLQKDNVKAAAKYLEDHPDVNLIITGYADVQTAYPAYNLRLSKRRAEAVYNMMVDEFNVDPSRIRVDYKGDTIQPYQKKNEWNRVVVFITEPRNK